MLYRADFTVDVQAVPERREVEPDHYLIHWPNGEIDQVPAENFKDHEFHKLFKAVTPKEKE